MPKEFQFDVFLSHNSQDKPRVRKLAERLRQAGLRVWFDDWVIKLGDIVCLKVDEGLEQSRVLVLCISPAALKSGWVDLERSTAVHRDPANEGRRFIPLLLADCDVPDTLRRYKYVDFREEADAALEALLASCRSETQPTPPASELEATKKSAKRFTWRLTKENAKPQPSSEQRPLAVLERKLSGHEGSVNSLAIDPDVKWVASGSDDKTVKIWDLKTGECRATLDGHTGGVNSVAITPDGKQVVSGSDDKSVRVWDALSGRQLAKLGGHWSSVRSVVALQDNVRVLSGGTDRTLILWDLASSSCIQTIEYGTKGTDNIFSTAVNPAGNQALSGHDDGRVRLWSLGTGECLVTLNGHSRSVTSVQSTRDGRFAVSGSGDKTVKIWDLGLGTCVGTLEGHQGDVDSVAISPDGTLIASSGSLDKTVRLWDWKSGTCVQVVTDEESLAAWPRHHVIDFAHADRENIELHVPTRLLDIDSLAQRVSEGAT